MTRGRPATSELEEGKNRFRKSRNIIHQEHAQTCNATRFGPLLYTCVTTHFVNEFYVGGKQLSNCRETGQDSD